MTPAERVNTSPLTVSQRWQRLPRLIRQTISLVVLLLCLALVWEGVKWIGGDPWFADANPFGIEHNPPYRFKFASNLNLPHLWDIQASFVNPARRNGLPLYTILFSAAVYTFREAVVGFLMGSSLGLILGIVFVHYNIFERGCMPYVIASQMVPIIAIAPMVVIWLKAGWLSVAIISAYLTFFPVTINTLRGLKSPDPRALELMHSYAASSWAILWKLRFPAALPYIFTALKVSATSSVVGAIIGELPSGIRDGLGGAILQFNQFYISEPSRLWATIVTSAAVGIFFFIIVAFAEAFVLRHRQPLNV